MLTNRTMRPTATNQEWTDLADLRLSPQLGSPGWVGMDSSSPGWKPLPPAMTQDDYFDTPDNDTFVGTTGDDFFDLSSGGDDSASGLEGDDYFYMGAAFTAADRIDGGPIVIIDDVPSGYDVMILDGDYSNQVVFSATTMTTMDELYLVGGNSYSLKLADANLEPLLGNDANIQEAFHVTATEVGAGFSVVFDASAEADSAIFILTGASNDTIKTGGGIDVIRPGLGTNVIDGGGGTDRVSHSDVGNPVTIDLSRAGPQAIAPGVTNTYLNIEDVSGTPFGDSLTGNSGDNWLLGNGGNDSLIGGSGNDLLQGAAGADMMRGGAGDDLFLYGSPGDSTSAGFDTILGFDFKEDHFALGFEVAAIDADFKGGSLSDATFDSDLTSAVNAARLGAGHAMLYTPKSGGHAKETFLIVDANGTSGYQGGADIVIRLDGASHLNHLGTGDFI